MIKLSDYVCNDYMKIDSGNGGTAFPDGQIITGEQYLHDTVAQSSSFIYVQDEAKLDYGGFLVVDFDPTGGAGPTDDDVVAVYGLAENPEQPGTKITGINFPNTEYSPTIFSDVGNVAFQTLKLPNGASIPDWQWPLTDGAAGSTLATDGNGGLHWQAPANPPNTVTDIDTTDFLMNPAPLWSLVPVSVTATQNSTPGQVGLDISLYTLNNNQSVTVRMLIDGTPTGSTFTYPLPRGAVVNEHMSWSPVVTTGQVIRIEVQSTGTQDCFVFGDSGDPTILTLLEPGGTAIAANVQGTNNVISPLEFWSRWSDTSLEKLQKFINRVNIGGGPPSWLDAAKVNIYLITHAGNNVNLLDPDTINEMNQLVTFGILTPAEAAIILAT